MKCEGKTLLGDVDKIILFSKVDNAQQCFAFTPQANFPANNLNLDKVKVMGLKKGYFLKSFQL